MFFHQYFLATLVDVLWNESAWKKKQGGPNKQTEGMQNSLRSKQSVSQVLWRRIKKQNRKN